MRPDPISQSITIQAPQRVVRSALTHDTLVWHWLCNEALLQEREGGSYLLRWNSGWFTAGVFKTLHDNYVAMTWRGQDDPGESQVEFMLAETGGGTTITVTHGGFGEGEGWTKLAANLSSEWTGSLANLKYLCEQGRDLRRMRRPMFGISFDALTGRDGIRLDGVLPEGSAGRAGLLAGDILIALNGERIAGLSEFQRIADTLTIGQVVAVEYEREDNPFITDMTMQARPVAAVQPSPAALVEILRSRNDAALAELDALTAAARPEELEQRPAADAWSVADNIAHLIFTERWLHAWVWGLMAGVYAVRWPDNNPAQISGILAAYPGCAALRAELGRAFDATYGTILALTPEQVAHTPNWTLINSQFTELLDHTQEHLQQIRETLEALRQK